MDQMKKRRLASEERPWMKYYPPQMVEGMEVTLQMLDGDGTVHTLPLEVSEGTIYTGKTYLEFTTGRFLTISAVFRDSLGTAYTQPLQEITVSSSSTIRSTVLWDSLTPS